MEEMSANRPAGKTPSNKKPQKSLNPSHPNKGKEGWSEWSYHYQLFQETIKEAAAKSWGWGGMRALAVRRKKLLGLPGLL